MIHIVHPVFVGPLLLLLSFAAATILPFSSEAAFVLAIRSGLLPVEAVLWASAGNLAGIVVNYWLGRLGRGLLARTREPRRSSSRQTRWLSRHGRWMLTLSWVPIIGDPLTIAAGAMSVEIPFFLAVAGTTRVARYAVIASLMA